MKADNMTIGQLKALSNRIEKEIADAVYYKLIEFQAETGLEILNLQVDLVQTLTGRTPTLGMVTAQLKVKF